MTARDPQHFLPAHLQRGARVGRLVVLDYVGGGANGIVLAAYDPFLDRRVAIKVLRPDVVARKGEEARERLLREARALGRLQHGNVLTAYEVGTVEGDVFIATEFAEGGTLGQWLRERPRSRHEILEALTAAGRGLAAAHSAGLVHRDFKPDNVLLMRNGELRVADFGLVGMSVEPASLEAEPDASDDHDECLTRTGARLGTPAYMAPEQLVGADRAGPAADQFSFCVCLYEALYGERPFEGGTLAELHEAAIEGRVRPAPPDSQVPAWLRRIVLRGLSADPAARYPNMGALLAALAADPDGRRRRTLRTGGLAATFAALGAVVVWGSFQMAGAEAALCEDAEAHLEGAWDLPAREAVRSAFLATGRPYAAQTFEAVAAHLDGMAGSWAAARREACEATHVRGEQSEALLDLRMRCLNRRLGEMQALARVLGQADAAVMDKALVAAARMTPASRCEDAEALETVVPEPADPATAAAIDEARAKLDRSEALEAAGRWPAALETAREALGQAEAVGWGPLWAEAHFRLASIQEKVGQAGDADENLDRAALHAAQAHDDVLAARIWVERHMVSGARLGRTDQAAAFGRIADAAVARIGRPPDIEARRLNNAAWVARSAGRRDEAEVLDRAALALRESALGPDHPDVAASNNNLAYTLSELGRSEEARLGFERALAYWESHLGPEHPYASHARMGLGTLAVLAGRHVLALEQYERVHQARRRVLGEDHPEVSRINNSIGWALLEAGRPAEALAPLERAREVLERTVGRDHPELGYVHANLARRLRMLGRHAEALPQAERAVAIREATGSAEHPLLGTALMELAAVQLALQRGDEALESAERAAKAFDSGQGDPVEAALSRFLLARVLRNVRRAPDRVRALAESARVVLAAAGEGRARETRELDAFLASIPKPPPGRTD